MNSVVAKGFWFENGTQGIFWVHGPLRYKILTELGEMLCKITRHRYCNSSVLLYMAELPHSSNRCVRINVSLPEEELEKLYGYPGWPKKME